MKKFMAFILCFILLCAMSVDCFAAGATIQRIGGGPSPSAAWEFKCSGGGYYTHDQLRQINNKLQGIINAPAYNAGLFTYNAAVCGMGYIGKKVLPVTGVALTLFGQSQFSQTQSSANAIARAYGAGGSRTVGFKEWIRPASGEKMYTYTY